MAKKMYIGVPTYKVVLERNLVYSSGTTWSFGTNTANEANWTKGENYLCDVTIDGVTYSGVTFSPDVGASWFGVYPEVGDPMFEVYVAPNNQLYDYKLGLDTKTSHTILISTGNFDGVARQVKKMYVGSDGVAREVKKGYIGVAGVARQFWQKGTPIGELPVGTTVKLNVNGTATNFLIVQQGLPSSVYDASCNGTWLLKKDLIEYMDFGGGNSYADSLIHSYMNGTFLRQLDVNIQSIIKQVKVPYVNSSGTVVSGSSGLSTKIFAISTGELGWTSAHNNASYGRYFPEDGAKLDYFIGGEGTEANNKRIAYYNGTASSWWTRSPSLNRTFAFSVQSNGNHSLSDPTGSHYIRPALILPSDTPVPDDMLIVL